MEDRGEGKYISMIEMLVKRHGERVEQMCTMFSFLTKLTTGLFQPEMIHIPDIKG